MGESWHSTFGVYVWRCRLKKTVVGFEQSAVNLFTHCFYKPHVRAKRVWVFRWCWEGWKSSGCTLKSQNESKPVEHHVCYMWRMYSLSTKEKMCCYQVRPELHSPTTPELCKHSTSFCFLFFFAFVCNYFAKQEQWIAFLLPSESFPLPSAF